MKLTVYRQSSKVRPDGITVYKGEDARPYVDDRVFFVADGLGGAAAIRHQKIRPEMFDSEQLLKTMFDGVFEDYSDERFAQYVTDSFFELFAVKDCYTASIHNIKKSGYFASRIVAAIILHELLYSEQCSPKVIFECIQKAAQEGKAEEFCKTLGDYFKKSIQENLRKVAQNANLIYETTFRDLALLGSTLCATIYFEREDCVEALYLTAGDSRPYVWDAEHGLRQILPDQERPDGGMTNYICANEDRDFHIRCNYFKFPKPCVLFNTSDGCFDAGAFDRSQLAFEKQILDHTQAAETLDELSEALTAFFEDNGRHDDSSTIAMKFFGYESYEDFKEHAARRTAVLNSEYFSVMPDLLETDYAAEYEACAEGLPVKLSELKKKIETEEGTLRYCKAYVLSGNYPPYAEQIRQIDGEIAEKREIVKTAKKTIERLIAENFSKFQPFMDTEGGWADRFRASKIEEAESKYQERAADYLEAIKQYQEDLEGSVTVLRELLVKIFEIGVPDSFEDYDDISYGIVEDCEKKMEKLFEFFADLKSKKLDMIRKLAQQRKEYIQKNLKSAQKYPGAVRDFRKMLVAGELRLEEVRILDADREAIRAAVECLQNAQVEVERLSIEAKASALHSAVEAFWEENYARIIDEIARDPGVGLSEEIRAEAIEVLDHFGQRSEEAKEKYERQKQLLEKYDEVYAMYLNNGGDET